MGFRAMMEEMAVAFEANDIHLVVDTDFLFRAGERGLSGFGKF